MVYRKEFHTSRPNQAWPFLLASLKSTLVFGSLQTVARIALTLLPIALIKKHMKSKWLRKLDQYPQKAKALGISRSGLAKRIQFYGRIALGLVLIPLACFGLVMLASVERTPITGRIRFIVISPDEEEGITRELMGSKWYQAIYDLLTTSFGTPKFIPATDWRYAWAERILRRLENVVPLLQHGDILREAWLSRGLNDPPFPPPPDYPLQPRPRASQRLHYFEPLGLDGEHHTSAHDKQHVADDMAPHLALGPPYSLLVADQPGHSNAFSYGFGPHGSGGVIIFSGFFDEVLRQSESIIPSSPVTSQEPTSLLGSLRRLFSSPPPTPTPTPTPEQDAQLAILVAHELSHLLLAHHLETLSQAQYFWPSFVSVMTDMLRAIMFPITMIAGPFVNDALKQIGEIGTREFSTCVDSCSSHSMEIEADLVSIRLLALAGWDARSAIEYWENRIHNAINDENRSPGTKAPLPGVLPGALWDGDISHPVYEMRVRRMKGEIERWQKEKICALEKLKMTKTISSTSGSRETS
ncbi:hypothetical protein M422DRAFT_26070 [Sphaerobolus stellatus SS14]|nr:hypothetical protein M422DRAFT_26070 [Sphaerobolus stellatus SS14]